jgi:hypothetical protein
MEHARTAHARSVLPIDCLAWAPSRCQDSQEDINIAIRARIIAQIQKVRSVKQHAARWRCARIYSRVSTTSAKVDHSEQPRRLHLITRWCLRQSSKRQHQAIQAGQWYFQVLRNDLPAMFCSCCDFELCVCVRVWLLGWGTPPTTPDLTSRQDVGRVVPHLCSHRRAQER